ncbi:MAG: RHS repeat-associated core domain-containing protein [Spirochaetales bacterium]|nr:RHS repeat-associated core domain-containing protein [Spirochaetales bacterium]
MLFLRVEKAAFRLGGRLFLWGYYFTSKEYDEETGLYYMSARYMNPVASRWVSSDPNIWSLINPMDESFELIQGFNIIESQNPYSYCGNNPVKYNDPTGKELDSTIDGKNYADPAQYEYWIDTVYSLKNENKDLKERNETLKKRISDPTALIGGFSKRTGESGVFKKYLKAGFNNAFAIYGLKLGGIGEAIKSLFTDPTTPFQVEGTVNDLTDVISALDEIKDVYQDEKFSPRSELASNESQIAANDQIIDAYTEKIESSYTYDDAGNVWSSKIED